MDFHESLRVGKATGLTFVLGTIVSKACVI